MQEKASRDVLYSFQKSNIFSKFAELRLLG